jgi:putative NADH-flavin reductase
MVVGADTRSGRLIASRFLGRDREVRVFVTDAAAAEELRAAGAKVALGDVSDDSHVAGACLNCFSVVLVGEAAGDDRQRSFAATPEAVMEGWAKAVGSAGVQRVIWVADEDPPATPIDEVAMVDPSASDMAEAVFDLDAVRPI